MTKPMLAVPMTKGNIADWHEWIVEEKYDGVRLIVNVEAGDPYHVTVSAWTRPRKHAGSDGKTMAPRALPDHLVAELIRFPTGVYDGELLGGGTSTDVVRTDLRDTLRLVLFDVTMTRVGSCAMLPYTQRRNILTECFPTKLTGPRHVTLAEAWPADSQKNVTEIVDRIWRRGGEGAILKHASSRYDSGKRSPNWIKVKKLLTTVCTIVGFEATKGTVLKRGAFATVLLEDENGRRTSVKTKDDYELAQFNKQWADEVAASEDRREPRHPALGRKLRIEYQDIAADGGYRHPRWDRWEEE